MNKNIYVELDSLFDTRLALVYLLDKKSAIEIVTNNSYYTRIKDNFGSISNDVFSILYRSRNKLLLTLALPTPIFKIVGDIYVSIRDDIKNSDTMEGLTIYINIFPYDLSVEECDNIKKGIVDYIPSANVEIINLSNEELTPVWVNEHLATIIKYDGVEWLEHHTANTNIISTPLLNITLIAPAIVTGSVDSKKINKDIFIDIMKISASLIDLSLVDSINFSRAIK